MSQWHGYTGGWGWRFYCGFRRVLEANEGYKGCRVLLFGTIVRTLAAFELFEGSALIPLVWALSSPTCQLPLNLSLCSFLFLCCCWSPRSFKLKPWNTDPETMGAFLTSFLFSFQPWTFTWELAMVVVTGSVRLWSGRDSLHFFPWLFYFSSSFLGLSGSY